MQLLYTFCLAKNQVKTKKQNGYVLIMFNRAHCTKYRPMHKIEQTTTGAISVIRQSVSSRLF